MQVTRPDLDVSSGAITQNDLGYLTIEEPTTRATVRGDYQYRASLQFRYRGPTEVIVPSGSGLELHQIGLMLRAMNPCNLVYVMWRLQPAQEVVVQVKKNAGQSTSQECRNGGYTTLHRQNVAPFAYFDLRVLDAEIRWTFSSPEVRVWIDYQEICRVTVPTNLITGIDGPVGLRTDNGKYDFRYFQGNGS